MATQFIFPASVTDGGALQGIDQRRWSATLRALAGKRIEVVIRRPKSKRSDDQNRWWWGVAVPMIADETGYDRHEHDQVHYALVAKCFGVRHDAKLGEVPNVRSSQLTVEQFSELMEWAARFAATELGIVLPLPGEALA